MPRAQSTGAVLFGYAVRSAVCAGVAVIAFVPAAVVSQPHPASASAAENMAFDLLKTRTERTVVSRAKRPVSLTPLQIAQRHTRARIRVVSYARAQRGKPYRSGSAGPYSFDCSGLTMRSMSTVGIRLPRTSSAQARRGVRVAAHRARPGDLVVWSGHVGVLSGRWRMVDAPGTGRRVLERAIYRSPAPSFRRLIG